MNEVMGRRIYEEMVILCARQLFGQSPITMSISTYHITYEWCDLPWYHATEMTATRDAHV